MVISTDTPMWPLTSTAITLLGPSGTTWQAWTMPGEWRWGAEKFKSMVRQLNLDGACLYHWELMNVTMATMVGEWSLAITDCQLYLQGGFNEPYHPGTGAEVILKVFLDMIASPAFKLSHTNK